MSDKLALELKETPEPLKMKLSSGSVVVIPPDVIRTVKTLPKNPEVDTIVALVSEDDNSSKTFYIATENSDGNVVWMPYVSEQGKMPEAYAEAWAEDAGADPYAEAYLDEETGKYTFLFGIPAGEQGEKGEKGEKGDKGDKGEDGKDGENGKAATINGENAFNMRAGYGLNLSKSGTNHVIRRYGDVDYIDNTEICIYSEFRQWRTTVFENPIKKLQASFFDNGEPAAEWTFVFTAAEDCELILDSYIKWVFDIPPQFKAGKKYKIHIAISGFRSSDLTLASFVEVSV